MKKLLLGTLVLLAFNAAVIITQMSCKKEAKADTPITGTTPLKQLDLILYAKHPSGDRLLAELWISKLDGTGSHKVNIVLPANVRVADGASITPDGKNIVFSALQNTTAAPNNWGDGGIYTCNLDGTNPKKVIDAEANGYLLLQGAY